MWDLWTKWEQNKAVPYFVIALLVMAWKNQLFLEAYDSHF